MKYAWMTAAVLSLALGGICHAQFHTNVITTPNSLVFNYSVDGSPQTCPTINLAAGVTNILRISTASSHPVIITTNISTSMTSWYSGANPENLSSGVIALRIPGTGFPSKLYYICSIHGFHGEIDLTAPPAPSANQILSLQV